MRSAPFLVAAALLLSASCQADRRGSGDRCDIDTLDGATLTQEEFSEIYVRGSRPVRLTGLTSEWHAAIAWGLDSAAIAASYGDAPLVSRDVPGSYLFGLLLRPVTMASYLESMADERAGLLFNSSRVGEGELWEVPRLIADAGLTDTVISVGPAGRGLGFHNHGKHPLQLTQLDLNSRDISD